MTADPQNDKVRRERLRRLDRVFAPSPIYFVTACTFKRRSILASGNVHHAFRQFATLAEDRGAYIGAYVMMPNHIHLFVSLDQDMRLSVRMKSLKNSLSRTLRTLLIPSPHWQKGFFDHVLRSSESYS